MALQSGLRVGGGDVNLTYAGDDRDGTAIEALLSHGLGPVKLSLSQTFNWGFESGWTGHGTAQAAQMTEGGISGMLGPVPAGLGLRETLRRDGTRGTDLRSFRMTTIGSITLMDTTTTSVTPPTAGRTSGSVMAMGQWSSTSYLAELDYGGERLAPTATRVSLSLPVAKDWDAYVEVNQPLLYGRTSLDIGASRNIGGFLVGPFATSDTRAATIGLRLWMPLAPTERSSPWLGPYYRNRSADARR